MGFNGTNQRAVDDAVAVQEDRSAVATGISMSLSETNSVARRFICFLATCLPIGVSGVHGI
jgi:hypothetical protein